MRNKCPKHLLVPEERKREERSKLSLWPGAKENWTQLDQLYASQFSSHHLKNITQMTPLSLMNEVVVLPLSHVWFFETPWTAAHQASLSFTIYQSLLKLMSMELVMPSNHLILCHPLLLLPSLFPSISVFSNELALPIRPQYWSFSFSISPSNEYLGLISFRMDWFNLLAFQRTLKSLLQHHSLKAAFLQCSEFFMIQLLHPYMNKE